MTCNHTSVTVTSKLEVENVSEFLSGEFVWNNITEWNLIDRYFVIVRCKECKRKWEFKEIEEFPEWIQEILHKELKRFGEE